MTDVQVSAATRTYRFPRWHFIKIGLLLLALGAFLTVFGGARFFGQGGPIWYGPGMLIGGLVASGAALYCILGVPVVFVSRERLCRTTYLFGSAVSTKEAAFEDIKVLELVEGKVARVVATNGDAWVIEGFGTREDALAFMEDVRTMAAGAGVELHVNMEARA